jgi:hypothetical protein
VRSSPPANSIQKETRNASQEEKLRGFWRTANMPRGPKCKKHPADVICNAVRVMQIATGEESENLTVDGKNAAEVAEKAAAKCWGI